MPKRHITGTDASFAALAAATGNAVVTFDKGFRRFEGVEVEIPE